MQVMFVTLDLELNDMNGDAITANLTQAVVEMLFLYTLVQQLLYKLSDVAWGFAAVWFICNMFACIYQYFSHVCLSHISSVFFQSTGFACGVQISGFLIW